MTPLNAATDRSPMTLSDDNFATLSRTNSTFVTIDAWSSVPGVAGVAGHKYSFDRRAKFIAKSHK